MSRLMSLLLVFTTASLWAQIDTSKFQPKTTIRVDVILSTGGHAGPHLQVQLRRGVNSMLVAMDGTNSSGNVEFRDVDSGEYNVRVTGDDIEPGESGTFVIEETRDFMSVTVRVKPAAPAEPGAEMRGSSVAAVDLNVSKKASKEYDHAGEEMSMGNWEKAVEHLDKAVAIYPQYSSAYNDLGVCYGRLKQKDKQREALLKAISVNDHCVPALVNLAHMQMKDNQFDDAVGSLTQALKADPLNVEGLSLLAQVEFSRGHYAEAITDAHKVHKLPHHFAIVHYTAASALQKENHIPGAIGELEIFLQEEPQGPRAQVVRKVLASLQSSQSQAQSQIAMPAAEQPQSH